MLKIFTLNWQGKDKLQKLVPTLLNSLSNVDFEWWIKDNNSNDGSIEYLRSLNHDRINLIFYKDNLHNFSEGMNYIFRDAVPQNDDLILLLNNDVVFNDRQSIKNMIDLMEKDSDIGVVGCRLLYPNSNILQHAGVVFNPVYLTPMNFRNRQPSDSSAEQNRYFQAVTGACLLTKAEYYRRTRTQNKSGTNGLDEKYQWAFEDVSFCLDVLFNQNKKIVYCGKTNISHEESFSLKKNPINKLFMGQNITYFKSRWSNVYQLDQNIYTNNLNYNLY